MQHGTVNIITSWCGINVVHKSVPLSRLQILPIDNHIVFLCTSALFLSGYVLQQKTLNDIRAAIKPQIAPLKTDTYLPPKFREGEEWKGKDEEIVVIESSQSRNGESSTGGQDGDDESMIGATRWQKAAKLKEKERLKEEAAALKALAQEKSKATKKGKSKAAKQQEDDSNLSRAARRKKIKEEIMAAGEGETFQGYRRRKWQ